jgi:hypothetical protein
MLNTYMAYSRGAGPEEGAVLVFAHSVQEARTVGWKAFGSDLTDDYLDFAATRIRNSPWLYDEANAIKLANDEPHVIDSPKDCQECEQWGQSPIGIDGLCDECRWDATHESEDEL